MAPTKYTSHHYIFQILQWLPVDLRIKLPLFLNSKSLSTFSSSFYGTRFSLLPQLHRHWSLIVLQGSPTCSNLRTCVYVISLESITSSFPSVCQCFRTSQHTWHFFREVMRSWRIVSTLAVCWLPVPSLCMWQLFHSMSRAQRAHFPTNTSQRDLSCKKIAPKSHETDGTVRFRVCVLRVKQGKPLGLVSLFCLIKLLF